MARQSLIAITAGCLDCGWSSATRNSQGIAHKHAQHHGHRVELKQVYHISPGGKLA